MKQEALLYAAACSELDEAEAELLTIMEVLKDFNVDSVSNRAVQTLSNPARARVDQARLRVVNCVEALTGDSWLAQNRENLESVLKDIMHYGTANAYQVEKLYRSLLAIV